MAKKKLIKAKQLGKARDEQGGLFKKIRGKLGEELAVQFLQRQGYRIIEQNFKKGYGEIDIVAMDKDTLAFVEVKTRGSKRYGHPAESITPWKLQALKRSVYYYKLLHPELPELMRIDLVAIELGEKGRAKHIELIKNISG